MFIEMKKFHDGEAVEEGEDSVECVNEVQFAVLVDCFKSKPLPQLTTYTLKNNYMEGSGSATIK